MTTKNFKILILIFSNRNFFRTLYQLNNIERPISDIGTFHLSLFLLEDKCRERRLAWSLTGGGCWRSSLVKCCCLSYSCCLPFYLLPSPIHTNNGSTNSFIWASIHPVPPDITAAYQRYLTRKKLTCSNYQNWTETLIAFPISKDWYLLAATLCFWFPWAVIIPTLKFQPGTFWFKKKKKETPHSENLEAILVLQWHVMEAIEWSLDRKAGSSGVVDRRHWPFFSSSWGVGGTRVLQLTTQRVLASRPARDLLLIAQEWWAPPRSGFTDTRRLLHTKDKELRGSTLSSCVCVCVHEHDSIEPLAVLASYLLISNPELLLNYFSLVTECYVRITVVKLLIIL